VGAVATPLLLLVAVAVANPLKAAPAPLLGAVKVTVTPLTGFPCWFFTMASSGVAKAVLTVALCGVPELALILEGVEDAFTTNVTAPECCNAPDTPVMVTV
jgi:hypothetical protein